MNELLNQRPQALGYFELTWQRLLAFAQEHALADSLAEELVDHASGACLIVRVYYTHPMSKRLQVVLEDKEMRDIERAARQRNMTLSEWVRQSLRTARLAEPLGDPAKKLQIVRAAITHAFPTAEIDQMVGEIEAGYGAAIE